MEAPRGAREPTGTNGPTLNNNPNTQALGSNKNREQTAATTIQTTINPHPTKPRRGSVLNTKTCGGHSTGETPSNIPNLEAKPGSANGTATDRLWESRTPPQHTSGKRPGTQRFLAALLCRTGKLLLSIDLHAKLLRVSAPARMGARSIACGPALVSLGSPAHARV